MALEIGPLNVVINFNQLEANSMKVITMIGSRKAPPHILEQLQAVAKYFAQSGVIIRSGKAGGMDSAALRGCLEANRRLPHEMYIPWRGFGVIKSGGSWDCLMGEHVGARLIAKSLHPNWSRCTEGAKKLHTRNVPQIMGKDLNTLTDLVLYWCEEKNGQPTGGTATAVNLAKSLDINTINMLHNNWKAKLRELM